MTGKEMLTGIQQLDVDLIEEAEFGAFQERKKDPSGRILSDSHWRHV